MSKTSQTPLTDIVEKIAEALPSNRQVVIRIENGWADVSLDNLDTDEVLNSKEVDESFDDAIQRFLDE